MASGHTGNVVPRKGLRVRVSCPPLRKKRSRALLCLYSLKSPLSHCNDFMPWPRVD
jgi:hypothetical protein